MLAEPESNPPRHRPPYGIYAYTAREWDPEINLYYYRARYYDPKIGRFIAEDPIGFRGGVNFYAYVHNNPINSWDPYGLGACGTGVTEPLVPERFRSVIFTPCCKRHDDCYETCSKNKECCDDEFQRCLHDRCNVAARTDKERKECKKTADWYYGIVASNFLGLPQSAWEGAQEKKKCQRPPVPYKVGDDVFFGY